MPPTPKKSTKIIHLILLIIFLIVFAIATYFALKSLLNNLQKESVPNTIDISQVISDQTETTTSETSASPEIKIIPAELNLKVPFYAQAPFANWDLPWQETCEEASVLLVANIYFQHNWPREEFNNQILALVEWEKKQFGDYKHTTVGQTAEILNNYLNLKTVIHENPTFEEVKNILSQGHLIVMTFAGKELGNPNYKNGGPLYHAMVIKGYKAGEKVITNDVGTRNGADYVYKWKTIEQALHDYNDPIDGGAKKFIEVLPPENKN